MIQKTSAIAFLLVVSLLHISTGARAAAPAAGAGSEGKKAHDRRFHSGAAAAEYRSVVQQQTIAYAPIHASIAKAAEVHAESVRPEGDAAEYRPTQSQNLEAIAAANIFAMKMQYIDTKPTLPFAHLYSQENYQTLFGRYEAIIDNILPLDLHPQRLVHNQNIKFALWTHEQLVTVSGNKKDTGHDLRTVNRIDAIHFWDKKGNKIKEIFFKLPWDLFREHWDKTHKDDKVETTDEGGKKRLEYRTVPFLGEGGQATRALIDYDSTGEPIHIVRNLPPFIDAISYNSCDNTLGMLVRTRAEGNCIDGFGGWNYNTILYNLETGNFSDWKWHKHDDYTENFGDEWHQHDDRKKGKSSTDYLLDWPGKPPHYVPRFTHPKVIDNSNDLPIEQITSPRDLYALRPDIYGFKKKWQLVKSQEDHAAYICDINGCKIYRLPNQHKATIIAWGPDDQLVTAFKDMVFLPSYDPRRFKEGDDCTGAYLWDMEPCKEFIKGNLTKDQLKLPRILEDQSTEFRKKNSAHGVCSLADCAQGAHVAVATLVGVLKTFPSALADKLLEHYKVSIKRKIPNLDATPQEDYHDSVAASDEALHIVFAHVQAIREQDPQRYAAAEKILEGYIV